VDAALLAGNRDVLAQDEDQASTSARAAPTSLLHLWEAAVTRLLSPSMRGRRSP